LPGRLLLEPGTPRDYFELERFHYLPVAPRTWQQVWTIRYRYRYRCRQQSLRTAVRRLDPEAGQLVAVGVLSWPVPTILARDHHFGMVGASYAEKLRFANQHIRTISRVVVHPQFRSLGLASRLIDCLCKHCPTRYVEAIAMMGHAHPMFERAGMRRIDLEPEDPRRPVYYILDRAQQAHTHTHSHRRTRHDD
jgi:GNAT superfamily N-acetyltransferase